ncbi:winged helix-turn-helix domain-containing protein [Pseudoxanthomonas suwonensis]
MPQVERRTVAPGTWRFGEAELLEGEGRLRVGGQIRPLDHSSLQVLRLLLQHSGEVVTKDELLEAGWPGRVVAENSLAKAIGRLRAALGNAAGIRAVHGYGYRLACPAHFEPSAAPSPATSAPRGPRRSATPSPARRPGPSCAIWAKAAPASPSSPVRPAWGSGW